MTDDLPMRLRPSARLQKYLGRELIADPNLAVLEFVKNAYDAGAESVLVEFSLTTKPTSLRIVDNGIGMDEVAFRRNWLQPGFSQKSPDYLGNRMAPRSSALEAATRMALREPAGEKGLGRLSAGRLGDVLEVWTRTVDSDPWLHVVFEWSRFEDMTAAMDEIVIPYDFVPRLPFDELHGSGTVVEVRHLRQKWTGRVPGRAMPGRRKTRLGRLHQDLQFLIRALPADDSDSRIAITLDSDAVEDRHDIGTIDPVEAAQETADYVYDFHLEEDEAGYVTVHRQVKRSAQAVEETGLPGAEVLPELVLSNRVAKEQGRTPELRCGPFHGRFLYTPPRIAKRAREIDAAASGVLVYRDNVLVEPYGLPGDDWLGAEARKASRQGHAAIQPQTFSGYVGISRRANPLLEDMSNRLGLLDNEASDDFFIHAQAEFRNFESILYREVLERRWKPKGQQASEAAARAERLSQLRLRALAHKAGQPLQALAFESLSLEGLAKREDLPEDVRGDLMQIAGRVQDHVSRLGEVVKDVADMRPPEFTEVPLPDLLQQVLVDTHPLAMHAGIALELGSAPHVTIIVPRDVVAGAVSELVVNAIEAPRPDDTRRGYVKINAREGASSVDVYIEDDGPGINGWMAGNSLEMIAPTKDRPAGGLVGAESEGDASNGQLEILSSTSSGTVARVRLPFGVSPVPRDR